MQNLNTDSVHVINKDKTALYDDKDVTGYTLGGKEVPADSDECLAKKTNSKSPRYWIKRGTAGAEAGRLFNPNSSTFLGESSNRQWSAFGKANYTFQPANKQCFDYYLSFLRTGDSLFVIKAEREV